MTEDGESTSSRWQRLALEHSGLVIAAVATSLVLVRVLQAANGSLPTALAIFQHADTSDLLLGVVVGVLPTIAVMLSVLLVLYGVRSRKEKRRDYLVTALWVGILAVNIASVFLLAVGILVGLVYMVMTRRDTSFLLSFALTIVFAVSSSLIFADEPWLPRQETTTDKAAFVGYELGESGSAYVFLTDKDRRVVFIPAANVTGRRLCGDQAGILTKRVVDYLGVKEDDQATYRDCKR